MRVHGMDNALDGTQVLLKMLYTSCTVLDVKQRLADLLTPQFLARKTGAGADAVDLAAAGRGATLAPAARQVLTWKQDVLWEDFQLSHYKFRNVLDCTYAEMDMFLDEEAAEEEATHVAQKARSRWLRAGNTIRTKAHAAWTPDPRLKNMWVPKAGFPHPSQATRHALRRGGTKGIIELMKAYPSHQTSNMECLWALMDAAAKAEDAIEWRDRLVEAEGVTEVVMKALACSPRHWGATKQCVGFLHYLARGNQKPFLLKLINNCNVMAPVLAAVREATDALSSTRNKINARASCLCDVCELAAGLLASLMETSDGRSCFKAMKGSAVLSAFREQLDGVPRPELVDAAVDACLKQSKAKPKKRSRSGKRAPADLPRQYLR